MHLWSRSRKLRFYTAGIAAELIPDSFHRRRFERELATLDETTLLSLLPRVDYYNRLIAPFDPGSAAARIGDFRDTRGGTYYLDTRRVVRAFSPEARFAWRFGDITCVSEYPAIVKSRPICRSAPANNANNVLLKLNRIRHYRFVRDRISTAEKLPRVVWRGHCHHEHRAVVLRHLHGHPRMDIGQTDRAKREREDYRPPLSIEEQLRYRFILSLEGKDVATNLKWILSSNSVCMMPEPRYETWFMEGTLKPWVHYVPLARDCADLEEKMEMCLAMPSLVEAIVRQANAHVVQFLDRRRERLTGLLVMARYLALAGQIELPERLLPLIAGHQRHPPAVSGSRSKTVRPEKSELSQASGP